MKTAKKAVRKPAPVTLRDLLVIKLRALYDTEHVLIKALPTMARKATDQELKEAFRNHADETRVHAARLEHIFNFLGEKPSKLRVEAIRGLVEDAKWVMDTLKDHEARDAALIGAASYVEHYEMAGYLAAIEWSRELKLDDVTELLAETLHEEIRADRTVVGIGKLTVNKRTLPLSEEGAIELG